MILTLALSHGCNLRCSYCYAGEKFERRMDPAIMGKALDLAFSHPDPVVRVAPFGGEPLLQMDLLEVMADQAKQRARRSGKDLRFTMTTNGTLLTDTRLDLLERDGYSVTVSLDGDRESHDSARVYADGRGSFDDVMAGMRRAVARLGHVRTVSVVHPGNIERLEASFDHVASLGVRQMSFNPDFDSQWTEDRVDRLCTFLGALADRVIAHYRAGNDFTVQPFHAKIVSRLKNGFSCADRCDFGCSEVAVAPSGRLYPCDRLIGEDGAAQRDVVIGHVDGGVDAARVSALKTRKDTPRTDCAGCAIIDRCQWWCGCVNRALTGRVDGLSGALCSIEQAVVRQADRIASTLFAERNAPFMTRYYVAAAAAMQGARA